MSSLSTQKHSKQERERERGSGAHVFLVDDYILCPGKRQSGATWELESWKRPAWAGLLNCEGRKHFYGQP